MAQSDDKELLSRISTGDEEALADLYDRYGRLAYALAWRVVGDGSVAEDVVQESFMSVWRGAGTFDPSKGNVRAWLMSVVRNRAIDAVRRARGKATLELEERFEHLAAERDGTWERALLALGQEAVRKALDQIPPEQKASIELAYLGGYTHREIAERLQVPLGTVKGRIRIGLVKLRALLQESI